MVWVKQCDQSYNRQRAKRAGISTMGWWSACMGLSAHEQTDGELERDQLRDAWHFSYDEDSELWGRLLLEDIGDVIAQLTALAKKLGTEAGAELVTLIAALRRKLKAPKLAKATVEAALLEKAAGAGLVRKPRGRGKTYRLEHPDGKPYLIEEGGHQMSHATNERRREKWRDDKARERDSHNTGAAIRLALVSGLRPAQDAETIHQLEMSEVDSTETPPQTAAESGASSGTCAEVEAAPNSDLIENRASHCLPSETHPTRPTSDAGELHQIGEAAALRAKVLSALRAEVAFVQIANDSLAGALIQLMRRRGRELSSIEAAISSAAEEAEFKIGSGTVRDPHAWLIAVLLEKCRTISEGDVAEIEHVRRKQNEAASYGAAPRRESDRDLEQRTAAEAARQRAAFAEFERNNPALAEAMSGARSKAL
jgi:hypothetical protein